MTRLTEATETFAWAREIDWTESSPQLRAAEKMVKKKKERRPLRAERSGCRRIRPSFENGNGSAIRYCQRERSRNRSESESTAPNTVYFSTHTLRLAGAFDHTGYTGRQQATPLGVRRDRQESQCSFFVYFHASEANDPAVLKTLNDMGLQGSFDDPCCFTVAMNKICSILSTLEEDFPKRFRVCSEDFYVLQKFYPLVTQTVAADVACMTIGTSVRDQAWERFIKPRKDAKIVKRNVNNETGKPSKNCVLIRRAPCHSRSCLTPLKNAPSPGSKKDLIEIFPKQRSYLTPLLARGASTNCFLYNRLIANLPSIDLTKVSPPRRERFGFTKEGLKTIPDWCP